MPPNKGKHQPECPLAHTLMNKLSIIIGNCDLVVEKIPEDSPILKRMLAVQNTAKSMVADLVKLECELLPGQVINEQRAPEP
jgi:hypothetical protein